MGSLSHTEENHLKAIFKITQQEDGNAGTNSIAHLLDTTAASVTDMLKRLARKDLISYVPRRGCQLTASGEELARQLVRKHRLWETFLVDKLAFTWDEVHEIAEQLEHIHSPLLVKRLADYLGNPRFDPHGDPIPDASGKMAKRAQIPLIEIAVGQTATIVGVRDHESAFLQYLDRCQLTLGATILLQEIATYDHSLGLLVNGEKELMVSQKVGRNLLVQVHDS